MFGWRFDEGRMFTAADVAARRPVAVLGRTTRDQIFGAGTKAVGQAVTIYRQTFTVVGITDTADPDQMEMAFVPYTALQDALGISYLHTITIEALHAGEASRIAEDATTLLRSRHAAHINAAVEKLRQGGVTGNQMPQSGVGGVPDDFTVKTQSSEALTKGLYTSVAAFILANMPKLDEVNLAEMNATLQRASTHDDGAARGHRRDLARRRRRRHHEHHAGGGEGAHARDWRPSCGRRATARRPRAVSRRGADAQRGRRRDRHRAGVRHIIRLDLLLDWPTRMSVSAIALAFGISAAIGIFFGFYPARRAARLDPINALRTE